MRHLFVINPVAKRVKNKIDRIKAEITNFFREYPEIKYEIYVSDWCRDSVSYIRSYITNIRNEASEQDKNEVVRVHAIGGTGTLFEVVNGVYGLQNVEVAAHPYGTANAFIRYFGKNNFMHFKSFKSLVFSDVIPIDLIRCDNNYGICFGAVGLEAMCDLRGDYYIARHIPADISYVFSSVPIVLGEKNLCRPYNVEIDGKRLDGEYISILVSNTPCYGTKMIPAPIAHPDDGKLEIFLIKNISRIKTLFSIAKYMRGGYSSIKEICHYSGNVVSLSTCDSVCMNIDGETFFGSSVEFELVPNAVKIVCPNEIDIGNLPLIYNKPLKGTRKEASRE